MESTTYSSGHGGPVQVVPVTVSEDEPVKARGCLSGLGVFMILLGLAIIAIEAASIGLYLYLESSAVGIYVGFFGIVTGIVSMISGGKPNRCLFMITIALAVICALKAFALFATSAALLAYAVTYFYQLQNQYPQYFGSYYYGVNYSNRVALESMIGLKAAVMVLYVILFIVAIIASALGCLNCCVKGSKRNSKVVMTTIYPNGRKPAVVQHKV